MFVELLIATGMVCLTVVIHGCGLFGLAHLIDGGGRRETLDFHPLSARGLIVTLALVLALFALHGIEIWSYAFLYHLLGAVNDLREAVYFSTISYAAIGYTDEAIAHEWQLLGAIEGINGIILLGWTTAFFVTTMLRFRR